MVTLPCPFNNPNSNKAGLIQVDRAGIAVPLDVDTQVLLSFAEIYHRVSR